MAATIEETNASRYPSEKAVKEALDMLKPPGILSKVGYLNSVSKLSRLKKHGRFLLSFRS